MVSPRIRSRVYVEYAFVSKNLRYLLNLTLSGNFQSILHLEDMVANTLSPREQFFLHSCIGQTPHIADLIPSRSAAALDQPRYPAIKIVYATIGTCISAKCLNLAELHCINQQQTTLLWNVSLRTNIHITLHSET